ncbi:gamma carbonic anhydrase family protein [Parasphingorhabdus halotolerans]|uniref:Gamma carbonic anhydrase family protein n=1 Tax=Parasphingorhabdus halotolerans TaxID=2725558 RepID=A0A6H2DQM1_9SPHN|nr:gamma carbonic anhydrase family protein [Parasphingorhabdus halotolerans]QJB70061.1 gamma carbonic anhydrase family protein [Parasphingorhabdus halotolerans]
MTDPLILPFNGKTPKIHESAFIAPGCKVIGDVTIGAEVSIWYNCVIRADANRIEIGARSNVQDGSVVHCDSPMPGAPDGFPTIIGEDVLIGHMAMIHGCTIKDRGFVGLSATVMNGCIIESDAMLGAGALLPEGKHMLEKELWVGSPAKKIRELPEVALAGMRMGVAHYVENGKAHKTAIRDYSGTGN